MTKILPIIEELDDCQNDAERAEWLLRVSDDVVLHCFDQARLMLGGFVRGRAFLALRRDVLTSSRDASGALPRPLLQSLENARAAMIATMLGAPGAVLR